jgi:predicted ABC-class ATPase
MSQQQAMDEDVTATNFLQKDVFSGVVEESGVVPRNTPSGVKHNT